MQTVSVVHKLCERKVMHSSFSVLCILSAIVPSLLLREYVVLEIDPCTNPTHEAPSSEDLHKTSKFLESKQMPDFPVRLPYLSH